MSPHSLPLKLIAGNAHPCLGDSLARELNVPLLHADLNGFDGSETTVHVAGDVRDASVFIVQPTCPPVNDHLMVLALLADAVRAAGAAHVTAVVPYFGYARQGRRGDGRDARAARVVGRLLGAVGINHLIALDVHSSGLESALPMPTNILRAEDVFLPRVKAWGVHDLVVVSPDSDGMERAERYATALEAPLAVIAKRLLKTRTAPFWQVLGDVRGCECLIVDDMVNTGDTLIDAAEALRCAGASDVHAIFTHAAMSPIATVRLFNARFGKILTTDSVPAQCRPWIEVVPIAPLLANAIRDLTGEEGSYQDDGVHVPLAKSRTQELKPACVET